MNEQSRLDKLSVDAVRILSIDAVEKANSGHPGMPMGAAPMAYTLWTKFMKMNPTNPDWFNRDRFVLSAGHGSMLLYSLLHLSGFDMTIDDLKSFRQWGSRTPGHPEYGHTSGVDATTGPLGQGLGMAVGMAIAERYLAHIFNQSSFNMIDHFTYAICSDGDLMEGISSESASLAGNLKLARLIVLYDSNDISLDGDLDKSFSENVGQRFTAQGWQVIRVEDGNDLSEISHAIEQAKLESDRPTLIEVKTVIGYGSPNKSGKSISHGVPLGENEATLTKKTYQWPWEDEFYIPEEVYSHFHTVVKEAGIKEEEKWNKLFDAYKEEYPEFASQLENSISGKLPMNWDKDIPEYTDGSNLATRSSSGEVLNAIAKNLPTFLGGSADLAGSNYTTIKDSDEFSSKNYGGRNIWFGVREFGMGAALNGIALHGGINIFGGTFLVFSDYLRPAIRLAALMKLPVTYVLTHDSIAIGSDGPTHQPIEQLASLRAMPNLSVIRPADGNEVVAAWKLAITSKSSPTALVLSRQNVKTINNSKSTADEGVKRGAYVISPSAKEIPDLLLIASGSEVNLAVEAQNLLAEEGIEASVVSMPAWNLFEEQTEEYKQSVLPKEVKKRLAIEMASPFGWERYISEDGDILAIDSFGASAPPERLIEEYGFTVSNVIYRAKRMLSE